MRSLTLAALAGLLAVTLSSALAPEARADHKRHWPGRHWHDSPWHGSHWVPPGHRRHGWKRHGGAGATILFGAPRRTLYVERPPRVIYVDPDPVIVQSPGYVERRPAPRYEPRYAGDDGRYCREANKTVVIDGRLQNAYGTACYQPDGSWQWVDD